MVNLFFGCMDNIRNPTKQNPPICKPFYTKHAILDCKGGGGRVESLENLSKFIRVFTESAHWDNSVSKLLCPSVVWRLLVKEHIANIGVPLDVLGILPFR